MKKTLLLSLALVLVSCKTAPLDPPTDVARMRFSVTPYGERTKATLIEKQKGVHANYRITRANFREATISQGSGREGFDTLRIFADGHAYAVFERKRYDISLTPQELEGLLAALNADHISKIAGVYSAGIGDGAQGSIEIITTHGRCYAWLDNYFDPVEKTYDYCNRILWPKVAQATASTSDVNPQAEYHRIFKKR